MQLATLDWVIVIAYLLLTLVVGLVVSRRSGENSSEFFLSNRNMPWWLLGFSMVATTFATDTPNFVANVVRVDGVAGNWVWWAFLLTGMLTVFLFSHLWRRSRVTTDVEFYELRYSGPSAAVLRGFRALYLGLLFNVLVMANVTLAAMKIGGIMLDLSPVQTVLICAAVTVVFSAVGGLKAVLVTDFLLFIVAMIGSISAAIYCVNLPEVGGLGALMARPEVVSQTPMIPSFSNWDAVVALLAVPLLIQWWSVWYPGSEPGGGGYVAQRMLAAKSEGHALGATLFFNFAHYALRPWPWIIVALCSIVVFPTLDSIQEAFPNLDPKLLGHDIAYPAMLTKLPAGLLGLVLASLAAAYMSTISTHLNWGSSYIVHDFYRRFVKPKASERELVNVGRVTTVLLMAFAAMGAMLLRDALQAFGLLVQIGAGTGLLFILRWYWWRINAAAEITAMIVSFLVAVYTAVIYPQLHNGEEIGLAQRLILTVGVTTIAWMVAALVTPPTDTKTLEEFYTRTTPAGPGWKKVRARAAAEGRTLPAPSATDLPVGITCMVLGCAAVYGLLFATGFFLYGRTVPALICTVVMLISGAGLWAMKGKLDLR